MRVIDRPNLEHVLRDLLRRARLRYEAFELGKFHFAPPGSCSTDGVSSGQRSRGKHTVMLTPLELAQRQLDAYNARDSERFLANFSENVKLYRMPAPEPALVGKKQFGEFYASQRFNRPALYAELVSRTVLGNKVFDRERVWGVGGQPIEMVVVFEVHEGLIQTVWGFSPD